MLRTGRDRRGVRRQDRQVVQDHSSPPPETFFLTHPRSVDEKNAGSRIERYPLAALENYRCGYLSVAAILVAFVGYGVTCWRIPAYE